MENIIVASSNLPVLLPIYTCYHHGDIITLSVISFVGLFSFLSHIVENHKHGMPGVGLSVKISYILNRFDVLGCILNVVRFSYLYLYYSKLNIMIDDIIIVLCCLVLNMVSEYDKYNKNLKYTYIITHCIWHVGIYLMMNRFLIAYIY